MGWFKKLANMARESNNARHRSYSSTPSYSNDDEYEDEDDEVISVPRVCIHCIHYSGAGRCCYSDVQVEDLIGFDSHTHGCEHFRYIGD